MDAFLGSGANLSKSPPLSKSPHLTVNVGSVNQYLKQMTEANTCLKLYHWYIISILLVIIYFFLNITGFRPGRQTSVTLRGGSDQCDTL